MQYHVVFEVIFFLVVVIGIIFIDHRLSKLVKIQRELLNDHKLTLARLSECETHLRTMREAFEAQTK